jgi:hypothetical protein
LPAMAVSDAALVWRASSLASQLLQKNKCPTVVGAGLPAMAVYEVFWVGSLILYQATYSAGRNSRVSRVATMIPPIMA